MINNIVNILAKELSSSADSVDKLRNLNKNPTLNNYLSNKQHDEIIKSVIQMIDKGIEPTKNVTVLKHYLHELGLIFNLDISKEYLQGVA